MAKIEYYGFVLYTSTWFILGIYISSIFYSPHHLAIAIPIWIISLIPFSILMYNGTNLINTNDFDSLHMFIDEHQKQLIYSKRLCDPDMVPVLQDVPIDVVNQCWSLK